MSDFDIYAIRYASDGNRRSSQNFLRGDLHDIPMPMDFFVWALVGGNRTIVIDTGFAEDRAAEEGYSVSRPVGTGLKQIGIEPEAVDTVILTHMHWDHAGNNRLFPNATYRLQEREMHYCTGRCMCHPLMRNPFKATDVIHMVDKLYQGRVRLDDGDTDVAPGLSVHLVGGHTAGLQIVRVRTKRGFVVLASDAAHYRRNLTERRPFPLIDNMREILDGFDRCEALASSSDHIIPGHDPGVLAEYPPASEGLDGTVRLDVAPKHAR